MSIADQKQALFDVITQLRQAEQSLLEVSRTINDPAQLIQINTEYTHLDSWIFQLLHAQSTADDALFGSAISTLKQQASSLSANKDHIQKIVGDVAKAAKIVGYLEKAMGYIAKL